MPAVIFEFMKKAKKVKIKRKETEKEKWKQNPEKNKTGPAQSSAPCAKL